MFWGIKEGVLLEYPPFSPKKAMRQFKSQFLDSEMTEWVGKEGEKAVIRSGDRLIEDLIVKCQCQKSTQT